MTVITKEQLEDASLDANSLEQFVNGPSTGLTSIVTTRTGETYKTAARIAAEATAAGGALADLSNVNPVTGRAALGLASFVSNFSNHTLTAGQDALQGNAGTYNTGTGTRAGQNSTGSFNTYNGEAAGFGANGSYNVYVGATVAEGAYGDRGVFIGPIAGRRHIGSSAILIGFAAFENVEGSNHQGIGDHAGAPPYNERLLTNVTVDPVTNIMTSDPPLFYGTPIAGMVVGNTYRLQFENGGGTAPLPLASVSTEAVLQSTGTTWTWLITSYDVTTAGSGAYLVGLCWYKWDNIQAFGNGSPDGPGQTILGFEGTREIIPPTGAAGLISVGRDPLEAVTWGERGAHLWRGISGRYLGAWANSGEAAILRFGNNSVLRGSISTSPSNGNMQFVTYNSSGVATATPIEIDNARGTLRPRIIVNAANDAAAAAAGVPIGEMYRNGSVLMIRVT